MKYWIGGELVDSLSLDNKRLNYIFALLISSTIWVLIGGNIIVRTETVFIASVCVGAASIGVILLLYAISHYTKNLVWGIILTSAALWAGVYSGQLGAYAVYFLIGIAGFYSARHLRWQANEWINIVVAGLIAALTVLLIQHAYTSFDIATKLLRGEVHQDTLFHASIAAMIKNYGVTSTGLNGLVPISYHVLSHVFFAALSLLSGVSVLEVYGIATWVLFAPLLVFSIVGTIAILDKNATLDVSRLWVIACLSLIALPYLFSGWLLWISYFISESYMVSLGIFVLSLPLLLKSKLSKLDLLLVLLTTTLITYAKGSVGAIYFGLWLTRLLFINDQAKLWGLLCLIASGIGVYIMANESANSAIGSFIRINWFHFIAHYSSYGACIASSCNPFAENASIPVYLDFTVLILGFFLLHFAPSFLLIILSFIESGFKATIKSPIMIYIGASTLAGIIITSSLEIPGGSAYYFSNVAMFVALPTFIALAAYGSQLFIDRKFLYCFVFICIFSIKYPTLIKEAWLTRAQPPGNQLVDALTDMRKTASKHHVYLLDKEMSASIKYPITSCAAQPFIYSALSERPWSGVIDDKSKCDYIYYGYSAYRIPANKQEKMPPPILQGMSLVIGQF
ncbi:hypothetical protein V0R37_17950 [Pollutimonas sp. H1-120]|uniref:hypothetical protein n=1 Tax=Pollutimonas sp. H1-120 TaxID=3148824 RepID=UPI003B522936